MLKVLKYQSGSRIPLYVVDTYSPNFHFSDDRHSSKLISKWKNVSIFFRSWKRYGKPFVQGLLNRMSSACRNWNNCTSSVKNEARNWRPPSASTFVRYECISVYIRLGFPLVQVATKPEARNSLPMQKRKAQKLEWFRKLQINIYINRSINVPYLYQL